MKKHNSKKRSMTGKTVQGMIGLGFFLIIGTFLAAGTQMFRNNLAFYEKVAFAYADQLSWRLRGERILDYLENGVEEGDEYYNEIEFAMLTSATAGDIKYYYVVVPTQEDLIYIWDVVGYTGDEDLNEERENQTAEPMEHVPYRSSEKEQITAVYEGKPLTRMLLDSKYEEKEILGTALSPVFGPDNRIVAVVGVDISFRGLLESMIRMFLNIFFAIALVMLISIYIYYRRVKKSLISPIVTLQKATTDLVENLDSKNPFLVDVKTGDEIEALAHSFEEMDVRLKQYLKENAHITAERERIQTELDLARRIQKDMLPGIFPAFPEREDFDIFASMNPAKEVGGDFYDFFLTDDTHLAVVVADVSGKGIPAALFMMMSKIMIQNYAVSEPSPARILEKVNQQICQNNNEDMFVTVWLGILDLKTGLMRAVNAGHEYPVMKPPGGPFEIMKNRHGFVVGGMEGIRYRDFEFRMEPGAKLFLYTDGLPEAVNEDYEQFGTKRMLDVLIRLGGENPETILAGMDRAVDDFVGDMPQFDDLTMLCLSYKGDCQENNGDTQTKELTIEASIEKLDEVLEFLDEQLEQTGCSAKTMAQLNIAVEEVFVNIAHYGYVPETGTATIRVERSDDPLCVTVTFSDHGKPFDPLSRKDPDVDLSLEEREIGGMGIFMVKQSMDDVKYEYKDGRNILTIKKNL